MRFRITDGNGRDLSASASVTPTCSADGAAYYRVKIAERRERVRIEWTRRMLDHVSFWHPMCGRERRLPQFFCAQKTESCFFRGAPVIATVRADGSVCQTVALAEASAAVCLGYYVDDFSEQDTVVFFAELIRPEAGFETELRVGEKSEPLPDALGGIWRWWGETAKRAAPLPESAFEPLYSTWYSFHQDPEQAALTRELRLAAELGFKTVILDDGWQFEGAGTKDYRKSGDWIPAPDKFPDFGRFVRDVHSFGQKLILWFAVPFAGFDTEAFRRYKDRLLFTEAGFFNAGTLDIRYPEVRSYLVGTWLRFIDTCGIDGLKLDFIDHYADAREIPPFAGGMDARTLTQAARLLLEELCEKAVRLKPGFLMEFRQYYVGPQILRFGNMLRVGDCAFDAVTNRIGVADLRMLTREIAVHSDMLLFSPDETPENCALQLLNVLFAVPQISVRLCRAGEAQLRLLKAYLAYWTRSRDVLLFGRFGARHPEACYSALWAADDEKDARITVLYAESAVRLAYGREDVWNATGEETVVLLNDAGAALEFTVYDCFGEPVRRLVSSAAAVPLQTPRGGRVSVAAEKRAAPRDASAIKGGKT